MKYKLLKEKTQIFLGLLFFFNQHCISGDFRRNYFEISNADSASNIYDTSADWIQFKKHYAFKNIYLVYAGPYPASPSSSFGHLFLLLEPIRFQENQILLWDVAEFSADVDEIKPIEKFYKGILGGLVGSFKIIPFYEKLRQYTFIESRPLWIFPIKTSPTESKTILYNLFQQFGKGIKYRFHDNNCASQIELLLKNSFNENQNISGIITSPRTVLINLAERLNKPFYIESTENLIKNSQIAKNIESKFGKLDDFDTNIKGAEAAVLLNVLEWKYFHRGTLLKKNEKIQIEKL
ncbi:MAG: DUF4105 domain-containing protein, partial [Bacteroidetes bacterium]|nr:DUF4105 domain-containing protein [Bacteroidota bacterium]